MENINIEKIWKSYDKKLEKALQVNHQLIEEVQTQKIKSKLKSLIFGKVVLLALCGAWVFFLSWLIRISIANSWIFLGASAAAGMISTIFLLHYYIHHIILIKEINNSESIIETQGKIAALKSSTLQMIRYQFIPAPLFTTCTFDFLIFAKPGILYWITQISVTVFFVFLTIWWIRNISIKNADKKWFKWFTDGTGWESVVKASEFMQEVETFKKEE